MTNPVEIVVQSSQTFFVEAGYGIEIFSFASVLVFKNGITEPERTFFALSFSALLNVVVLGVPSMKENSLDWTEKDGAIWYILDVNVFGS